MSDGLATMREQVYSDPRPEEYFDRFHERSRSKQPDWVYDVVRVLMTTYSYLFFRMRALAAENVPASGAAILAPNHFSYMDHFFSGAGIRRKVRFMAKSQLFSGVMSYVYSHGGVFPVRRGARDEQPFVTARSILEAGGVVAMYCEGGRSRTGRLSDAAKPGIGRLALESGAPIVPVAIFGSSKVRNWKKLQFPAVTIQYGRPIAFERVEHPTREQMQAAADEIFDEIKALYGELERAGRRSVVAGIREQRRRRGSAAAV
ncbi:MAG TPA: lysophospholipid acyltransferase family protein [Solirubrobacteraceae bacterium]|nr:lysophospholipid acyltransferase family protein [Solirubrobacteraceae bacterium]